MRRKREAGIKRKFAWAAVFTGAALCVLTVLFIQGVKSQLWEQSVDTILESTRQGCNTLKVQLQDEYEYLGTARSHLNEIPLTQREKLEEALGSYAQADGGVSLYLPDGTCVPAEGQRDEEAARALRGTGGETGIIDPHISSVTGVNVFDLFLRIALQDGTEGFLLKEYEVESIVDSFSLSFYNNAGFSYVVNTRGDILIRAPHPNSNKTVKNLFDVLPEAENGPGALQEFKQSLADSRTGYAVFQYQGEATVFCYTPLKLQSDWYLVSIIPKNVVEAQTNAILWRSIALIGCILLGIALLVSCYFRYASRTNQRLRNQAAYTGHLYNAVPEGIAVLSAGRPFRFHQLNREGLRLLGYPEESPNDLLRGKLLEEVVHPEDYEGLAEIFHDTAVGGGKNGFEVRVRGGELYFWAAGIVEKTLDEDGNPVLITAVHDITEERREREEREREKLQERRTLVGAISNAYPVIISINLTRDTLNFIYLKPGLMLRLGEQKTFRELYEGIADTIHPDGKEEFRSRFAPDSLRDALARGNGEVFLETKQLLEDGEYHWTSVQIIQVDNPYSEDQLAILLSRRIDGQKYEEEQRRQVLQAALDRAEAASRAKGQFLSNMSHDIRTPMNAIVGMTAIASAHMEDRERVAECLRKIGLSSRHLLSLINDILDMSKIESGKLALREEPFNLAELASDCIELVQPQAKAKMLGLEVRLGVLAQEKVIGDPLRVRQVYINILSNAVKYTQEGGRVLVEVSQEGGPRMGYQDYLFRCADTGVGMAPEFLEKLFQPFERAQDAAESRITGTGLGMAITKNVADLMNGEIQVESEPGKGTVFTVRLPLKPQEAREEETPREWLGVKSLIADDDRQTCENAAELLEGMGLRPRFVTGGREAVKAVAREQGTPDPFRLVIVDWNMPDMDGVETARRIREQAGPELPVIVLTAYDWTEIENEAKEAGVTAFLSKPFYRSKICYLLSELSGERDPARAAWENREGFAGKRILLAEDNEINREIARTLLEELGLRVEEAVDGAEAVKRLEESEEGYYDLIFMDVQMPKLNGYEATGRIRALQRTDAGKIPIVAMTANAFEEDVRAALRAGMDAHLAKPIDTGMLEKMLFRFLGAGRGPGENI